MLKSRRHRGVAIVECAFVLPVLFFILFAMLDLGMAVLRYNTLAEASRCIAREAVIHGSIARVGANPWGPNEFTGTVADDSEIVLPARSVLPTMRGDLVSVRVTWLDNDNSPHDRVQVELRYQHDPMIPGLFAWGSLDLRAATTMNIVN